MKIAERNRSDHEDRQIRDARQFCGILQTVPVSRRDMFAALANAYMDGMAAGEAIAAAGAGKVPG